MIVVVRVTVEDISEAFRVYVSTDVVVLVTREGERVTGVGKTHFTPCGSLHVLHTSLVITSVFGRDEQFSQS